MKKLDKWEQHIVLYCKGHYRVKGVDFMTGLRRIWAVRCGIDVEHIDKSFDEYISNFLVTVLIKCGVKTDETFFQRLHKELYCPIQIEDTEYPLIKFYRSQIHNLQVYEKGNKNPIIRLHYPQVKLFRKIVSGKGEYKDYDEVKGI